MGVGRKGSTEQIPTPSLDQGSSVQISTEFLDEFDLVPVRVVDVDRSGPSLLNDDAVVDRDLSLAKLLENPVEISHVKPEMVDEEIDLPEEADPFKMLGFG